MRGRNLRRTLVAAGLVAASAVLVLVLAVAGLLAFIVTSAGAGSSWNASMDELSAALVRTEGGYAFTGGEYLAEKELWAMLVDEGGAVVWQQGKPADVPDRYSLTDVAAFTRWYLSDYPVQVRVREDGLLVAGGPKGSTWKHPFVLDMDVLKTIPFLVRGAVSAGPAGGAGPHRPGAGPPVPAGTAGAGLCPFRLDQRASPMTSAPLCPWSWATPGSWRRTRSSRPGGGPRPPSSAARARPSGI